MLAGPRRLKIEPLGCDYQRNRWGIMFIFNYDPDRVLLEIVQTEYWTPPMVEDFNREFLAHHLKIRAADQNYRVLADCTHFPVQSSETSATASAFFARIMAENQGRYAILAGSVLNKIQAKRAITHPRVEIFLDRNQAMAWLFEDGTLPA